MISIKTILTISSYEGKVLWRNWFFRIVALLGLGFVTIFNLVVFTELDSPTWYVISNGWILPLVTLLMISIPQAAAVIFLATGLIKKDKKLDTNEVFFVRPITNLDYVLGKALALFKLFFLLNVVLLCIPFIVGLTNPQATVNPGAFVIYLFLTSVPSIIFTTGISFLLVTIIRNQPISIVLLLGIAGVQLIYYFDQFSNIFDFTSFRLSTLASEISGFVNIEFAIWQRAFYLVTGISLLFVTAFLLDRLTSSKASQYVTGIVGVILLGVSGFIMITLWSMRQDTISLRNDMITVNGRWTDVPNIDIKSNSIVIEWTGDEIAAVSDMIVQNNTSKLLDTIYFSLNPGLAVDKVLVNEKEVLIDQELQIVSINKISINPGEELNIRIKYHGTILESVAHLDVDQERYEMVNEHIMFSLSKKYAFLEDDYVLLTKDVLWYPDTEVGYNRKALTKQKRSFIDFSLTVKSREGKTPISQGEVVVDNDIYKFKPEYPLPSISLVIGQYQKKEISVDGISYSVFHYPENDFFLKHLNQLGDTLNYLIKDVVDEYEDVQKLSYPFKRLQFVEVPLQFAAYNKIYESHQAHIQPETVFWPEEGGKISQFDFRKQLKTMTNQASKSNLVLSDKQKQANVFKDLIRKVFTKQIGSKWVYDGKDVDNPDYSLFPNYYDFNSGIVSEDWALLNRSIANYLRNDKQIQNDYSREVNGISFTEECNDLMRTSSLPKILTEEAFSKISKSVTLKSQYLFSYLGHTIGENAFKTFLYDWVNTHQHQLNQYEDFRMAILSKFNIDIDPVIRTVYSETSQPAFEILDVQRYEVMDGDRKRYQVLMTVKNSGDSDGVMELQFKNKKDGDDDNYYAKINEEVPDNIPGIHRVVKKNETRLFGFILDEKPGDITINTLISKNIPSIINIPSDQLSKRETSLLFEGERVIEKEKKYTLDEVIVDNEDQGFTHFSPIKPTVLKAWLDSRKSTEKKYHGIWDGSYASWHATTSSNCYGRIIRSAHFTRSGNGEKIATWTPELKEEGFYDIYVYMKGKNQNEYLGRNKDKQFDYNYIIHNGDGTDNIKFNISEAEPGWNYLGSYYFNKTGGSVSLTDKCDMRTVYADAVKWVKQ